MGDRGLKSSRSDRLPTSVHRWSPNRRPLGMHAVERRSQLSIEHEAGISIAADEAHGTNARYRGETREDSAEKGLLLLRGILRKPGSIRNVATSDGSKWPAPRTAGAGPQQRCQCRQRECPRGLCSINHGRARTGVAHRGLPAQREPAPRRMAFIAGNRPKRKPATTEIAATPAMTTTSGCRSK